MAQYMFSFLTTSLFMGLIILAIVTLSVLLPKVFSPKLRYAAWVVILIGLIIPFRPMFGNGLITFDMPYATTAESERQANKVGNITTEPPIIGDVGQSITIYEPAVQSMWQTLSTIHILVIAWAAVALAILTYHVWRYIGFKKLIRRWGVAVKDEDTLSVLQTIQSEKGIANKKIELKKCDFVSTSMIVGFLNPIILLPDKMFDADELELIFRHELIHYKRGDLFIKLLSVIAVSLNWFNPAVYLMSAAIGADCEASCDEAVIADVGGENKQFYAEIVMDMIGSKRAGGTALSTCFYGSKNGIKKRMEAIMNASVGVKKVAFSALAVLALMIIFTGSIFAFGSQTPSELPSQEPQYPVFQPPLDNSQQQGTEQITSQRAREIAAQFVGYGTVHDIRAFTEDGILNFEVEIRQGAVRYVVQINGVNGNVINLSSYTDDTGAEQTISETNNTEPTPQTTPDPTPPQAPVSSQGNRPANPVISLDRAIEIAYADIAARGINATFRTDSGMSWERGQWVWELEFRTHGERMPIIEFYINVDNGNIVKFEWDD
ncbi:MAG: hypothetical protein FWE24_11080 [Defluviitaleaceae bacterium]|nr:hypothetical protein [Defluviitaleaceae bacterium]